MMFGLGATGVEVNLPGLCMVGGDSGVSITLSDAMGGFGNGLKQWAYDPNAAATGNSPYSFSGFANGIGTNIGQLFDPTLWACNPSFQIGRLIPPLAVVVLGLALLKRRR